MGRRTRVKEAIMKGERLQKEWNGLSEEIVEGMAKWRGGHPKATIREIELVREYGVCEVCGQGIFPLAKREELQKLSGRLTPHGHECLVRLAGWLPSFEKAAELLGDFLGIEVSKIVAQK